jgi:hypothetical protein
VLASVLAFWLACPPTADAKAPPKQPPSRACPLTASADAAPKRPFEASYANPYGHIEHQRLREQPPPLAPSEAPIVPDLPLWDLEATLDELDSLSPIPEWDPWLRWVIAEARGRPATAQAALVEALASDTLSAARLAWWRSLAPVTLDDQDALLLAFEVASSPTTRVHLATELALTHWQLACPVALGPDWACRAPGSSIVDGPPVLLRRDPIAVESARRWTGVADRLRREVRIDPTDHAALALRAELVLVAGSESYELLLIAQLPGDPPFVSHELAVQRESAFFDGYNRCRMTQHDLHRELLGVEARIAVRVLLRESLHLQAHARQIDQQSVEDRDDRRRVIESRNILHAAPRRLHSVGEQLRDVAHAMSELCVEIGAATAVDTEVIAACQQINDRSPSPLVELVAEPRSTTEMQSHGVVSP